MSLSRFAAVAAVSLVLFAAAARAQVPDMVIPEGSAAPESIAVMADGTVLAAAQGRSLIWRVKPGETVAEKWLTPKTFKNGFTHGVMPDEKRGILWTNVLGPESDADGAPSISALVKLDLKTGAELARYPYEGPERTFFNDVTLAADGTPYIPDSSNARIMRLDAKTGRIVIWAADPLLARNNGLAFIGNDLYVGVHDGNLIKVPLNPDGTHGPITKVKLTPRLLTRPDGFRSDGKSRIVVAEVVDNLIASGPVGRGALITIKGDTGTVETIKDHLWSPSAGAISADGTKGLILESKLGYHSDPAVKGQDPGAIHIYTVPLPPE